MGSCGHIWLEDRRLWLVTLYPVLSWISMHLLLIWYLSFGLKIPNSGLEWPSLRSGIHLPTSSSWISWSSNPQLLSPTFTLFFDLLQPLRKKGDSLLQLSVYVTFSPVIIAVNVSLFHWIVTRMKTTLHKSISYVGGIRLAGVALHSRDLYSSSKLMVARYTCRNWAVFIFSHSVIWCLLMGYEYYMRKVVLSWVIYAASVDFGGQLPALDESHVTGISLLMLRLSRCISRSKCKEVGF